MNTQVYWEAEIAGWMNPRPANSEKEAIEAGIVLLAEFGLGKANGMIWLYKDGNPSTNPYSTIHVKNNKIVEVEKYN